MLPATLFRDERELTAEIDAEAAFKQLVRVIDGIIDVSENVQGEITHVASCSFWHSLMGVEAKGKPTTKVLTWADTRSKDKTEVLRKRFDETAVHNRTGARFHSSFWPAKLLALTGRNPSGSEGAPPTARWLSFTDFVNSKLFNNSTTSISIASGTGIFSIRECEWDDELLRYLKVKSTALPEITSGDDQTFTLTKKWAKRWPVLANARWFPSIADGAANNVGSRCTTKRQAALMIGTSGAMRVTYKGEPPTDIPPGLFCYRLDRKRVVVGGALSDGGGIYAWLKKTLRVDLSDAAIGKEMSRRGADAHGLTFMPFFAGERSTGYNENAFGSIIGLNALHDAVDILQAAMESVAYRFAEIFDQLKRVTKIDEIVVSGGALDNSPVWTQMLADVFGRDLAVSNTPEASMRGAVLLALESLGKIESIDSKESSRAQTKFHPKCHEIYKKARKRHAEYYEQIPKINP
jgi:gluconokinase